MAAAAQFLMRKPILVLQQTTTMSGVYFDIHEIFDEILIYDIVSRNTWTMEYRNAKFSHQIVSDLIRLLVHKHAECLVIRRPCGAAHCLLPPNSYTKRGQMDFSTITYDTDHFDFPIPFDRI